MTSQEKVDWPGPLASFPGQGVSQRVRVVAAQAGELPLTEDSCDFRQTKTQDNQNR